MKKPYKCASFIAYVYANSQLKRVPLDNWLLFLSFLLIFSLFQFGEPIAICPTGQLYSMA